MNPEEKQPTPPPAQPIQPPQPVAYDAQGRPLYAHPPVSQAPLQEQPPVVVHVARRVEPEKQVVSPTVKKKHDRSMRQYPTLNLSDGEYIINAVRRHPIGLFFPLFLGTILMALSLTLLFNYAEFAEGMQITGMLADPSFVTIPLLVFTAVVALGMFVSYYVYTHNRFYLTNESVIQEIQYNLFSHLEQTVSLANIEDASYTQKSIIQQLFNYGDIRLSTEGDETTYRFSFVANPKGHIATLNNAVEAFKNGRPVDPTDN